VILKEEAQSPWRLYREVLEEEMDFGFREEEERRCRHRRFDSRSMRQRHPHMGCAFALLNEQIVATLSWKEGTVIQTMVVILKKRWYADT
jgi:hypothetical protein